MTEIEHITQGFFYLQADPRLKGANLVSRPASNSTGTDVLIGMDSASRRHLLVLHESSTSVLEDALTANLSLTGVVHEGIPYVDLACSNPKLGLVFERLCADVVTRLSSPPKMSPEAALVSALDDWKTLFLAIRPSLTREEEVGLHGELAVLERFARIDPSKALGIWTGPTKSLRDFSSASGYLEVKATTSQDAKRVTISSLDQLDPAAGEPLFLAVVRLQTDTQGETVSSLMKNLVGLGVPRFALERKVAEYGYDFGNEHESGSYEVADVRAWAISDSSPGLRRSELGSMRLQGVERVKYGLSLEALGTEMSDSAFEKMVLKCLG